MRVSPIAWTRICGSEVAVVGMRLRMFLCAMARDDFGAVNADNSSENDSTLAGTSRRLIGDGKGSAVRLACFLRIFRVASALAN